jgi:AraC-like DNA-binding protein
LYSIPVRLDYQRRHPIDVPFHSHSEYEIYYFQGGKCNYLIGDKIYVLQPGDLIIMHGMTLHCPNIDPKYEYVRSMVHFDSSYIDGLFSYPNSLNVLKPFQELGNFRFHLTAEQQKDIESLFRKLHDYRQQQDLIPFNRFNIVLMELLVFIYSICEKTMALQPEFPSEKVKNVQNIISYIEHNFMKDLHLTHLEQSLHLNKFYLSKIFKEVTGVTIFNYLLQRRINEAKVLFLLDNDKSVTEVGYQVGFKHPAHFSRIFKKQVNCTAEQYRKGLQKNTNES